MKKLTISIALILMFAKATFSQDTSPAWVDEIAGTNATNITQNIYRHGKVGIGTPFGPSNPIEGQLHVRYNNTGFFKGLNIQNDGGYSLMTLTGTKNGTNLLNWLQFNDQTSGKTWAFIHDYDNSFRLENAVGGTFLKPFWLEWGAPNYSFYMKASGNIGINTNTPQSDAKLHIKGNRFVLEGEGSTTQDFAPVIDFKFDGRSDYWSLLRRGANWADANEANNLKFGFYNGTTWVNSFRLDPEGQAFFYGSVGIGVDKSLMPGKNTDYRLYVDKGILTEKVKVAIKSTANWSDFVFNNNYRLMPLTEVDTFVKTNHHLPGIPSAEEVVEQGVDLATMDAKLLQKVEELTLYLIQLKKENDELKKRIDSLEQQ